MRTILIMMDSLNRHFLKLYNPEALARTPCLDTFGEDCAVFDRHFIGSAPCMPARRDIFTGRMGFLERCWGGIEPFDVTLPQVLRKNGVFTHIVTDHTHYFEIGGEGYIDQFDTWDYQRGQEMDKWVSRVRPQTEPEHYGKWSAQYDSNRTRFLSDADYPTPKTFRSACGWLEDNWDADDYFLMVEAFDPHEPFDCPEEFLELYGDDYDGRPFNWSSYNSVTEPPEAVAHLRRRYCATLSMADKWLGKFLDTLRQTGAYEDSLIIFTTDHGHLLGEHGYTGKNLTHAYNELAHIPLLVKYPGGAHRGERIRALTQNIDIMPTVLEHHGIPCPDTVLGRSWAEPQGGAPPALIYGWHGQAVNVTDGLHTYFRAPLPGNEPCFNYCGVPSTLWRYWGREYADQIEMGRFLSHTSYPVYRIPANLGAFAPSMTFIQGSEPYHLEGDWGQSHPISDPELEASMCRLLRERMRWAGAPEEQYRRLGL